ncbi:MAG TPA: BON domain-containing protein, partial [Methylomirabilota bacterium]|nr:BON domain-containing protein [Methylomirabilota bacterium]
MLTRILVLVMALTAAAAPAAAQGRSVGEFIDDTRIAAEVKARLTAEAPSNFVKIDVTSDHGIVTLAGTVDSYEKRATAAQIAGNVKGVKGLVNNVQVAGTAPAPTTAGGPVAGPASGGSSVDATGTVASVDPATGTITLSDGRVLRATDRTAVYQPTTMQSLRPGDRVLVRGAAPATVQAPETRMGTVARVDAAKNELLLTDGTVVRVPAGLVVRRGIERLTLGHVERGA